MTETALAPTFQIDPTAQDALFRGARSVRAWSDEPVPEETVEAVYDLVRWGPTALNTSPLRLLQVRTPEARERLAAHMGEGNRQRVLDAPLALVLAADTDFHENLGELMPHMPGAAALFADDLATRERLSRDNAHLQAGYLLVGLRAAGLDIGPMSGMDASGIDVDLLAGTSWRSIMVVLVGRPAADNQAHPRAARLDFERAARAV
ncbi:malonic semialdehyde reductase [Actinotalea sp.]|uniref:malonic semialdehyde reductase n=2 Tax=Actinotalea sp. TaxID=1872145 RepID=UPI0035639AB6